MSERTREVSKLWDLTFANTLTIESTHKDLGHLRLAYIRKMQKAGTVVFWCSFSQVLWHKTHMDHGLSMVTV